MVISRGGGVIEEILAGGCCYLVGDFRLGGLPEDEQLLVTPFVMQNLHMAGLRSVPLGHCIQRTKRLPRYNSGKRASEKELRGVTLDLHYQIFFLV